MMHQKTPEEIAWMREGGKKLGNILQILLTSAVAGITLLQLEDQAQKLIAEAGGTPSFQTVDGYRWATCLCVNEVVVHGIPTPYLLQVGDVLTIDIGMLYKGFHTDTAWTKIITNEKLQVTNYEEKQTFLNIGMLALERAMEAAKVGNHIGDISYVIQKTIEDAGYSVVKSLTGHGVGKVLHEDPQIPNYVRGKIDNTSLLVEGMTIAIEPIYTMGKGEVVYENDDGWTIATRDRSLSAVFEHTIALTHEGSLVLTKSEI